MTENERMKRARTLLLMHQPFFGFLTAKLKLVEDPKIPTLGTDGNRLLYNPDFTKILKSDQLLSGWVHEVMHLVYDHLTRRGSRRMERWNRAGDYAINIKIDEAGFAHLEAPGLFRWLLDKKYVGWTADQIYDDLQDQPEGDYQGDILIEGSGGQGDGDKDGDGKDKKDGPAPSQNQSVKWRRAVVEAANFAKMRGKLPAFAEEFVDGIVNPKIDWKRIIRSRIVSTCHRNDWSYRRPNRRYAHTGIIAPTPYGERIHVEVWIDSSGSIGGKFFATALGGVVGICNQLKVKLTVGVCDAAVQLVEHNVTSSDILKRIKLKGRGGTDFRPAFEDAKKRKPGVLIYFTDLFGSFPEQRPKFETLWLVEKGSMQVEVPFGRKVEMNEGEVAVA